MTNLLQGFARDELLPHAADWDAAKHFPVDTLRRAAELGFAGIYVGEDVGGSGLTRGDAAMIFEALAYGDVSTTAYLTIHNMVPESRVRIHDKHTLEQPSSSHANMAAETDCRRRDRRHTSTQSGCTRSASHLQT